MRSTALPTHNSSPFLQPHHNVSYPSTQQKRPGPATAPGRVRNVQDACLPITDLVGGNRAALPSGS